MTSALISCKGLLFLKINGEKYFEIVDSLDLQVKSNYDANDFIVRSCESLDDGCFVDLIIVLYVLDLFRNE